MADFMTSQEVAAYFGKCIETLRLWIRNAKAGKSTFPLPVTGRGQRRLWRRSDIENWDANRESQPEAVAEFRERAMRRGIVRNQLVRHGINLK